MKGIELAERYYKTYGEPMLSREFPEVKHLLAVGIAGSGSECFGYDDALSRDHDFDLGFAVFLPDEEALDRRTAFFLERAYAKLPSEFMGVHRLRISPVGGKRRGVMRMADFFLEKTGTPDGRLPLSAWLSLPEQSLAEAVNGKVFYDPYGEFTAVRERLAYFPEDVRKKKLAGELLLLGQAGEYNYERCLSREDRAGAQLSIAEFVNRALHICFLLERRYRPYYKWTFRALRDLPSLSSLGEPLELLLSTGNTEGERTKKRLALRETTAILLSELRRRELTRFTGDVLEGHAHSVNGTVEDPTLRNAHILSAVE